MSLLKLNLSHQQFEVEDDDGNLSQEGLDFASDLYKLAACTAEELHSSWKVFTTMKDNDLESRRLENIAWRLQAMRKQGREPVPGSKILTEPLISGRKESDPSRDPRAEGLIDLALGNRWDDKTVQSVLDVMRIGQPGTLPSKATALRQLYTPNRPVCAVFTHSLERNGANNFCLYIVRLLLGSQYFVVFSPKEGPMREDFEALDLEVVVVNTTSPTFLPDLAVSLRQRNVGVILANTIMRCDVVLMAASIRMPSVWVIHESWPQDQFDYYAKEVFMCKDINAATIRKAFASAGTIVFPSDMQKQQYNGLFSPEQALTIYNGIPLEQLDAYKASQDRKQVRAALGYTDDDFLVLHIGTICRRKAQIYTATACASLIQDQNQKDLKVLLVGARYIRDHEIKYIDEIKAIVAGKGLECVRYEDTPEDKRGQAPFTLMDIQSEVLRFYMAADVVLVPSLNEVLPLVICEAMAFERPVICSRIDAIPEAVDDGVESFLVPPADSEALAKAIMTLKGDTALRVKMGKAGRERVHKQFSYTSMGQGYRELVDRTSGSKSTLMDEISEAELRTLAAQGAAPGADSSSSFAGRTILIDMDNTLADWDAEFIKRYGSIVNSPMEAIEKKVRSREHFEIEANFEGQAREEALNVIKQPGFYEALLPMPGAVDALKAMLAAGADVRLVTAPHPSCPGTCANEKYTWVQKHLGDDWVERIVVVRDKTFISGDLLVDDKPEVTGLNKPRWAQVLFDAPYNRSVEGKPRLCSWSDWEPSLSSALKSLSSSS